MHGEGENEVVTDEVEEVEMETDKVSVFEVVPEEDTEGDWEDEGHGEPEGDKVFE